MDPIFPEQRFQILPLGSTHQKKVSFTFGPKALNREQREGGSRDPGRDKHLGMGGCTRLVSAPTRLFRQPVHGPRSASQAGGRPVIFKIVLELYLELQDIEMLRFAIFTSPLPVKGGFSALTLNPG